MRERLPQEEHNKRKAELWASKEKIYVTQETSFTCPDTDHPMFTINVTKNKPGICYYCSKVFLYKEPEE